jgi:hypothetical protein
MAFRIQPFAVMLCVGTIIVLLHGFVADGFIWLVGARTSSSSTAARGSAVHDESDQISQRQHDEIDSRYDLYAKADFWGVQRALEHNVLKAAREMFHLPDDLRWTAVTVEQTSDEWTVSGSVELGGKTHDIVGRGMSSEVVLEVISTSAELNRRAVLVTWDHVLKPSDSRTTVPSAAHATQEIGSELRDLAGLPEQ